jgi:hypothetical protein
MLILQAEPNDTGSVQEEGTFNEASALSPPPYVSPFLSPPRSFHYLRQLLVTLPRPHSHRLQALEFDDAQGDALKYKVLDCGGKRYVHLSVNNGDFLKLAKLEYEDGQLIDEKDESTVPDEAQQRVLEWLQACKPHVETHIGIGSANVSAGRFIMGYQLHICTHAHTHAFSARACCPCPSATRARTHTRNTCAQRPPSLTLTALAKPT